MQGAGTASNTDGKAMHIQLKWTDPYMGLGRLHISTDVWMKRGNGSCSGAATRMEAGSEASDGNIKARQLKLRDLCMDLGSLGRPPLIDMSE